jgi:hypothetical protein
MLRSCGAVGIAFVVACFLGPLGHAQDEVANQQQGASAKEAPKSSLQMPLPVQIIENDESAEARQRYETISQENERNDLIAQQRVADATDAINGATQSMMWAAWLSAFFVGAGTFLLVWTLVLTRQANKAARDAVTVTNNIGYGQLRPYIGLTRTERVIDPTGWQLQPVWKNFGQTPATNVKSMIGWAFLMEDPDHNYPFNDRPGTPVKLRLGPGDDVATSGPHIPNHLINEWGKADGHFYIWGWIEYSDAMQPSRRHRSEFCGKMELNLLRDRWAIIDVGPHNGSDDDCLKRPQT